MIDSQTREQNTGIEHIVIDSDDMPGTLAKLKVQGAKILEETAVGNGRKATFFENPEGVCLEVLELPK